MTEIADFTSSLRYRSSDAMVHYQQLFMNAEAQRKEIEALNPSRVLVVDVGGKFRAKFVAHLLELRGYEVDYKGLNQLYGYLDETEKENQQTIEWAQVIIFLTEHQMKEYHEIKELYVSLQNPFPERPLRVVWLNEAERKKMETPEIVTRIQKELDFQGFTGKKEKTTQEEAG